MCAHARQQNQRKRKVRRMRYRVSERARLRRHVQSVRRTGFDHLFNGKGNPMRDGGIKQKNVTVQKEKQKSLKIRVNGKKKKMSLYSRHQHHLPMTKSTNPVNKRENETEKKVENIS